MEGLSMNMALLIVDLQKAYHKGPDAASMDSALGYINAALPGFRAKGLPVIWIQHDDEESPRGSPGFDLIDGLQPLPGEHRIVKRYNNSFNKTDCASILAAAGADTVVISGYCAEWCILSTYRGALDLDLQPVLLRGAVASGDEANLGFVERICGQVSLGFLLNALKS
jgi:nicotinamidase-related amidase